MVERALSFRKNTSGLPRTPAAFIAFREAADLVNFLARRRLFQRKRINTSFGLTALRNSRPPLEPPDFRTLNDFFADSSAPYRAVGPL